jgi:hypothetical protein
VGATPRPADEALRMEIDRYDDRAINQAARLIAVVVCAFRPFWLQ